MKSVIVSGTDTDVGKTFVSALLMTGLTEYSYWKPVQSGTVPVTDSETVRQLSGATFNRILPEAYVFEAPLSPHAAAPLEGRRVELAKLELPSSRPLIVEGAGGALVPLNDEALYADQFAHWGLPVIVVTRSKLGTISHTLLTLEALRRRSIPILGCVINGERNRSNEMAIEDYGEVPILGVLEPIENPFTTDLRTIFQERLTAVGRALQ